MRVGDRDDDSDEKEEDKSEDEDESENENNHNERGEGSKEQDRRNQTATQKILRSYTTVNTTSSAAGASSTRTSSTAEKQWTTLTCITTQELDIEEAVADVKKFWPKKVLDQDMDAVRRAALALIEDDGQRVGEDVAHTRLRLLRKLLGLTWTKLPLSAYIDWANSNPGPGGN